MPPWGRRSPGPSRVGREEAPPSSPPPSLSFSLAGLAAGQLEPHVPPGSSAPPVRGRKGITTAREELEENSAARLVLDPPGPPLGSTEETEEEAELNCGQEPAPRSASWDTPDADGGRRIDAERRVCDVTTQGVGCSRQEHWGGGGRVRTRHSVCSVRVRDRALASGKRLSHSRLRRRSRGGGW